MNAKRDKKYVLTKLLLSCKSLHCSANVVVDSTTRQDLQCSGSVLLVDAVTTVNEGASSTHIGTSNFMM